MNETLIVRKKKILNNLERMWTKCRNCLEPGNLENMIRQPISVKNSLGIKLFGAFYYFYYCSLNCQGLLT